MNSKIEPNLQASPEKAEAVSSPWLNVGAALAAIGASLCCVGPFVLVLMGLGGSWMSTLVGMAPYRPVFILLSLVLLGWAFYKLYFAPCEEGSACAISRVRKRQRIIFWTVTILVIGLIAFPWYAPFFLQ